MRKQIKTKSGFKTHIDSYAIHVNGRKMQSVWGITKARNMARQWAPTLFGYQNNKVEIINEYTGEISKIS